MRSLVWLLTSFILTACCATPPPVPDTEEGVAREAALLIRASLTDRLVEDTEAYYRSQASSMLAGQQDIPIAQAEALVDEALQPLVAAEHQRLVETLVPIYMRFYTAEEIHQLLSFYQTEVARKSIRVGPQIAAESQKYVRLWSEHFGETLLQQVREPE